MIELKEIKRERQGKTRIYTANFTVQNREYKMIIKEWYLWEGVEYNIKFKEQKNTFFKKLIKQKEFPKLSKEEWYELYFKESNKLN